jgi:hypothetical protein
LSDTNHQKIGAKLMPWRGRRRIPPAYRDLRPRTPSHPESQLQLATFSHMHDDEITELEAALRELWVMEQKNE